MLAIMDGETYHVHWNMRWTREEPGLLIQSYTGAACFGASVYSTNSCVSQWCS